jgi:hypothetical protein
VRPEVSVTEGRSPTGGLVHVRTDPAGRFAAVPVETLTNWIGRLLGGPFVVRFAVVWTTTCPVESFA